MKRGSSELLRNSPELVLNGLKHAMVFASRALGLAQTPPSHQIANHSERASVALGIDPLRLREAAGTQVSWVYPSRLQARW